MNRVTDYIRFAILFVGLGYIVLWPLTAHDDAIAALDMSLLCGPLLGTEHLICRPENALRLSPGLHLLGSLSAACVMVHVLLRQFHRARRARAGQGVTLASAARVESTLAHLSAGRPAPPCRAVKPRAHFGLRGVPH